jgi:hypothetical protein
MWIATRFPTTTMYSLNIVVYALLCLILTQCNIIVITGNEFIVWNTLCKFAWMWILVTCNTKHLKMAFPRYLVFFNILCKVLSSIKFPAITLSSLLLFLIIKRILQFLSPAVRYLKLFFPVHCWYHWKALIPLMCLSEFHQPPELSPTTLQSSVFGHKNKRKDISVKYCSWILI